MDQIKARLSALRIEADESAGKAEEYKKKADSLEMENTQKEHEINSLTQKNQVLEAEVEKLEASVKEHKGAAESGAKAGSEAESLQRKIQLLEEEAEESDRTIRDVNDKLRQTDVKAGHYERKVQALEQSRDQWESKYEEMAKKYAGTKKELEDFAQGLNDL